MTHYETLGVKSSASPREIKAAFRRAASEAHPDRQGGDAARMAEINRAYEVLSDVERRKRYDESGVDSEPVSAETVLANFLMGMISNVIEAGEPHDLLGQVRHRLRMCSADLATKLAKHRRVLGVLRTKTGQVSVSDEGRNLFEMVMSQKITHLESGIVAIEEDIDLHAAALTELKRYKSIEEAMPMIQSFTYSSGGTGTATW